MALSFSVSTYNIRIVSSIFLSLNMPQGLHLCCSLWLGGFFFLLGWLAPFYPPNLRVNNPSSEGLLWQSAVRLSCDYHIIVPYFATLLPSLFYKFYNVQDYLLFNTVLNTHHDGCSTVTVVWINEWIHKVFIIINISLSSLRICTDLA